MTETMESSSQRDKKELLYDPVRKKWVEKNPEEVVRQWLIRKMILEMGYPISLIAVEKELSILPHLQGSSNRLPKRRADILVFSKRKEHLVPLILIECKAEAITSKFSRQVIGYNRFVGAPYVVLASKSQILTGNYDREAGAFVFKPYFPRFEEIDFSYDK